MVIQDQTPTLETETRSFEAEVSRLLHLVVHAVYSEKEIFLRELISNASDACDKLRYEAIAAPQLLDPERPLGITIVPDAAAGTLTISDTGIGMDRAELIDNLGTIARSGTKAFLDKLQGAPEGTSLIGQFGVGFYSAFMVAETIAVASRKAGSGEVWIWQSDGVSGFTIRGAAADEAAGFTTGTRIVLSLKPEAKRYLDPHEIEAVVRRYSDHILFPVLLQTDGDTPRQINSASALWQRPKSEVSPEAYTEAYRAISGQFDEPALTLHYKAEGRQAYAVLLFVPKQRPFDLFDPERRGRVKLYVRRVYITDEAGLLPSYLRFVRGVVDSEDVPLNISREMLQNNPLVAQIRKALASRVLSELETLAAGDAAAFQDVWEAFGSVLKEGIYEDHERRNQILKLARFRTSAGEGWRTLADYVAALRPNQTDLFYLAGDSLDRLNSSPQLEAARARGVEVLLLTDPVDHFWVTVMFDGFEGKPLRSLTQGDVDLSLIPLVDADTDAAGRSPAEQVATGELIARLKASLAPLVSDVRASKRLVTSAVCLVAPGSGPDRGLGRLLRAQDRGASELPVLEINPNHALVQAIAVRFAQSSGEEEAAELAGLLLDQARILDGEVPANPARYAETVNRLIVGALAPR